MCRVIQMHRHISTSGFIFKAVPVRTRLGPCQLLKFFDRYVKCRNLECWSMKLHCLLCFCNKLHASGMLFWTVTRTWQVTKHASWNCLGTENKEGLGRGANKQQNVWGFEMSLIWLMFYHDNFLFFALREMTDMICCWRGCFFPLTYSTRFYIFRHSQPLCFYSGTCATCLLPLSASCSPLTVTKPL